MKLLIQRVREASVEVGGEITGRVDHGFLVFVGVAEEDTTEIADKMIDKMVKLRIFEDENGKTNKSMNRLINVDLPVRTGPTTPMYISPFVRTFISLYT